MPVIISATQLRAVLGVSSGLFNDDYLNQIINTAEAALKPFLQTHSCAILEHESKDNIITFYADREHKFYVGQTVEIVDPHGHGFNGQKTILEIPSKTSFKTVGGNINNPVADIERHAVIPSGEATTTTGGLAFYADNPEVESAVYEIATDVFQSRTAPGGTPQALDFTPGPYRMGKALYQRVAGLLASHRDIESAIG
jgi:hypothetical protein